MNELEQTFIEVLQGIAVTMLIVFGVCVGAALEYKQRPAEVRQAIQGRLK